jgi:hypothetical protein
VRNRSRFLTQQLQNTLNGITYVDREDPGPIPYQGSRRPDWSQCSHTSFRSQTSSHPSLSHAKWAPTAGQILPDRDYYGGGTRRSRSVSPGLQSYAGRSWGRRSPVRGESSYPGTTQYVQIRDMSPHGAPPLLDHGGTGVGTMLRRLTSEDVMLPRVQSPLPPLPSGNRASFGRSAHPLFEGEEVCPGRIRHKPCPKRMS